jgi:CRP-like cAMP-binding protein
LSTAERRPDREIALIEETPRTATVTARTDEHFYTLAKEPFLAAVTGHPATDRTARALVKERLETLRA